MAQYRSRILPSPARNLLVGVCLCPLLFGCAEIDNYEPPNGGIYGVLTDNITKAGFQSEQPNGFSVKLFEKGGELNSPIVFSGKPDGTFENAWIFQNEYQVLPADGAFFPVDTATVQVGDRTEVNFSVTPFLAVTGVEVEAASRKIVSSYRISRSIAADKIIERKTLVSKIPTVNNVIFDYKKETDLSGIPDEEVLGLSFTDEVTDLPPGDYYVRVGVCTDNALKRYNYSEVFKVNVP